MIEVCICGHTTHGHVGAEGKDTDRWCVTCLGRANGCEMFKLDNLKFIEDLAKERNLV